MSRERKSEQKSSSSEVEQDATIESAGLEEVLKTLPEEQKAVVVGALIELRHHHYRSLLPTSGDLKENEATLPGSAHRTFTMVEEMLDIYKSGQKGKLFNERLQVCGAILLGALLLGLAALALVLGNPVIALPLGLAGMITTLLRHIGKLVNRRRE